MFSWFYELYDYRELFNYDEPITGIVRTVVDAHEHRAEKKPEKLVGYSVVPRLASTYG